MTILLTERHPKYNNSVAVVKVWSWIDPPWLILRINMEAYEKEVETIRENISKIVPNNSVLLKKLDTLSESTTANDIMRDCQKELIKYGITIIGK
jgi:hypothetical protein